MRRPVWYPWRRELCAAPRTRDGTGHTITQAVVDAERFERPVVARAVGRGAVGEEGGWEPGGGARPVEVGIGRDWQWVMADGLR